MRPPASTTPPSPTRLTTSKIVRRLREQRPEPDFTISLRYGWDGKDDAALGARLATYGEAGVDHVLVEPAERALEDWLRAVEWIARAAEGIQP